MASDSTTIVLSKKTSDPNSTMSSVPTTPATLPPGHPPLPPLTANTHETDNVALATSNSSALSNASVDNFVNKFLATMPENHAGDEENFLGDAGAADDADFATPTARPLFEVRNPSPTVNSKGSRKEADAPRGSIFPSTIPKLKKRFFNQDSELNDEGYDSEGGLPFFANEEVDNPDEYFEATLGDAVEEPTPAAPSTLAPAGAGAAAAEQLTVEGIPSLKVKDLKEELRRRGRSNAGKKAEL